MPVTFLHMQVMFTTISRDISADGNASAIRNRIEHQSHMSQDLEQSDETSPGERMTYLYRWVMVGHIFLRLMAYFRLKDCQWPLT
jgi:hypothetical protein